ncbi:DedA family protein [Methylobacterium persicinum]|uniref:Membrane protein DedA with SNARE-associated domain n=1 Tax=Methylobacterium persicinum TaxID=374426 RepID=A0ABU0HMM7_9HYPH|nr:DedA family protein [Methylobacterium persicinum]MDQ0443585.1 membrane protein DedA with SNARE-associated domain [Methylobacterium persicinum]GJE36836.1 Inner membrane protein YabI [Methylobacterium persicinum]
MDIEALKDSTLAFVETHKAWTPVIAAVLAFCESVAVLSLFVPATVILMAVGALIGGAGLAFWPVVIGAALGAATGDWLSYEVGRWLGPGAKQKWPLNRYPAMTLKAEGFIGRWGVAAVALGRFFGPARALVPLLAGVLGMARLPFQFANVTSAAVWAFVLLAPGAGLLAWFDR